MNIIIYRTFFSCPAAAKNFPWDEKSQHDSLLLLGWILLTSPKGKSAKKLIKN